MKVKLNSKVWVTILLVSILATSLISYRVFGTGSAPNIPNIYHDVNPLGIIVDNDGANGWFWYSINGQLMNNNTVAAQVINNCIGNCTGGETICIKKGTYTITTSIVDTGQNNINLIFDKGAKLFEVASMNTPPIILTSVSNWKIEGVEIDGNKANQGAVSLPNDGIRFDDCSNCFAEEVNIHDMREFGVAIYGASTYCGVRNSNLTNNAANGIQLGNLPTCNALYATGNDISGFADVGISFMGVNSEASGNFIHDGVTSGGYVNVPTGIYLEDLGGACGNETVVENHIWNIHEGIRTAATSTQNMISLNTIFNWDTAAAMKSAIYLASNYNTVRGNILTQTTGTTQYGIRIVSCSYNIIDDNQITSPSTCIDLLTGSPVDTTITNNIVKSTLSYGISLEAGTTSTVTNNDLRQCTTYFMYTAGGTNSIINHNPGFTTENSGSAINATKTTFSITHALAGTPTGIWVSFNSTAVTAWTWTSTSSTITVTMVGPNNNVTCYWNAIYVP